MTVKNFVLDTNVLLHDPEALFSFEENHVIVPIYVIEEIDKFKRDGSEIGRSARGVSRSLDRLRARGDLAAGVELPEGGQLRVAFSHGPLAALDQSVSIVSHEVDSRIIQVALETKSETPDRPTVLVSKDVNLRIRADALGLIAADYEHDRTRLDDTDGGFARLEVPPGTVDALVRESELPAPEETVPHQFVELFAGEEHAAVGRVNAAGETLELLGTRRDRVWGISPRNLEQSFAMNLLLDDRVKLVTIVGKAGTGKTLLALAAALHKVHEAKDYQRVLVSRPIFPMGRDLGYLPGTVEEKLRPWMQPIFDNLELLLRQHREAGRNGVGGSVEEMLDLGVVAIEPLTYIRGRSIPSQYLIVDEAQNLTVHEVKTIVSRAGEGTKVVLTGDPQQIDNPYMDAMSNGLIHAVNRFRGSSVAGHITLRRGERSALAELAAERL